MKYVSRALHYVLPYRRLAVVSVVLLILASLVGLLTPWPLKLIIDSVLGQQPLPPILTLISRPLAGDRFALLIAIVLSGLAITLIQNSLTVLDNYVNTKLNLGMALDFRSDLFQHLQRLEMTFHERHRAGMLMYINFLADAAARLVMTIPALAQSVFTLVGMFWITFQLDRQLALLSLTVVPLLYYSVGYYTKHIQERLYQVRGMEGESLAIIHESLSMLRVVIAFGREGHEQRRFRDQGNRALDARVALTVRQTLFSLAVNTTTALGTALVLGFGSYHVLQGRLTAGSLLVVLSYIAMVYKPLEAISTTIGLLQDVFVNLKIAYDLLETKPQITDSPGAITIQRTLGHVAFEGVHFHYEGRSGTLRDISFEARAGEVFAIVGPTGAGKTTLVSLLPRFLDPDDGRILLDGMDIRQITLESLRRQISIVLQEPLLFSDTIANNIRYGRLDASMDEIIAAARAANAHDFIMGLPDQYDTQLGERGSQISGGERQRISVARAFLKDAPILILDEPTSSIDSKTEAVVLDALDRLMVGRTTFLIAHRFSTIRNADHILVLNEGQVVEQGKHHDLMRQEGMYKHLHNLQTRRGRRPQSDPAAFHETTAELQP